jgi:hypothetical protein
MENIPAYIRRKHGQEPVTYLHPLLEPFLERTYGIFVYQEDIMAAAVALGGFSGPEADTLGYAIRKKKSALLRAQKEKFVERAAERGVPAATIDAVFKAFEPFERYGFNKAHATCYGLVAYQTAYLKANHTVEYMTAVLTAFRDNAEKVAAAIAECRRLGIEVRPPDVHQSHLEFTVEADAIRFGLLAVKNVGEGAIESIIAAREADGRFRSLTDFCSRVDLRLVNRKVVESLARVGALNALGHPAQILLGLDDAMAAAQATQRDRLTGQTSLFDLGAAEALELERPLPPASEAPVRERLRWEKELLGLYLSEHPMGEIADQVGQYVTAYAGDLGDESLDGQRVVLGGIVTGARTVITRSRATMAVVTLEDLQGSLEVVVFPKLYEQTMSTWADGAILLVAGRIDHRGDEVSLLADLVVDWDDAIARGPEAFAREVAAGERGGYRRRTSGGEGDGNGGGASYPSRGPAVVAVGSGAGVPVGPGGSAGADRSAGRMGPVEAGSAGGSARSAASGSSVGSSNASSVGSGSVGSGSVGSGSVGSGSVGSGSVGHGSVGPLAGVLLVSPLRPEAWPPGADAFGVLSSPAPNAPAAPGAAAEPGAPAELTAVAPIAPAEPVATYAEPQSAEAAAPDLDVEPALPDEVGVRAIDAAGAPTPPTDASPNGVLHVRFSTAAGSERVVAAMETFKAVIRDRPGATRVVLHVPAGGTSPLPMELRRGVAYDADLLAEVRRRLGEGLVELRLA